MFIRARLGVPVVIAADLGALDGQWEGKIFSPRYLGSGQ